MDDLLGRGPTGRFISSHKALRAWLPELLDRSWGNELAELLTGASEWCLEHAARHHEKATRSLRAAPPGSGDDNRERWAIHHTANAAHCLGKRKILVEARKHLQEISHG